VAPDVGQALREARARRGIDLDEVERITKIRVKYLRAMEEDRWEVLPGAAYAIGFLSTYARFLGLDDRALIEEYRRRHQPADTGAPIPQEMLPKRGEARRSWLTPRTVVLIGLVAAAVLGVVVVLVLSGDSGDDGRERNRAARPREGGGAATTTPAPGATTAQPDRVSLTLRSTGTVWVCLIDDRDRRLVNGETLTAAETRGPFEARAFEVTFGNGSIGMELDDEPVDVPAVAEPIGYRITPRGASELDPSAQPTCL
jgi:cytoskeleton protein RodZ